MSMRPLEQQMARRKELTLQGIDPSGDDDTVFGERVFIHCDSHGAVHVTGWCTVPNSEKTLLMTEVDGDASYRTAGDECRERGLWLYADLPR